VVVDHELAGAVLERPLEVRGTAGRGMEHLGSIIA
jgi:hypothetical protein